MFNRIVVATDYSSTAEAAYPLAAGLAMAMGGKLYVVHVDQIAPPPMSEDAAAYVTHVARVRYHFASRAADFWQRLGVATEDIVAKGPLAEAVVNCSKRCNADLVLVARHGLRGSTQLPINDVIRDLLYANERPTLIVPQPKMRSVKDGPLRPKRIVALSDLSTDSHVASRTAAQLAARFNSKLSVLHTLHPLQSLTIAAEPVVFSNRRPLVRQAEEKAARRLLELRGQLEGEFRQPVDAELHLAESVVDCVNELHAAPDNIVVAGSHGRGRLANALLGSTTHALASQADAPLLVLPPEKGVSVASSKAKQARPAVGARG
ncbi:MAG: universal stress protein [Deltaproteobacteria bacterium]|nr:universal stress protein [Deltaproteobacteria bacterium]